jgi:hypothetical protein
MNQPLRSRLKVAASAFGSNAVNGNLRRAQLSYFAAWTAEWAFTVALGIVAYQDGGATAVGLVGLVRMVPSAVVAPLAAPLADRGRRERVLVLVATIRAVATAAAGIVVALDEPVLIVYVLAALSTVAGTLYRPAHSALLPSLCGTGQELVPMFQPLPLPAIEQLARGLEPLHLPAGQAVFRQGDPADRFYVIEAGAADVVGDGRLVTTLGPGEGFG